METGMTFVLSKLFWFVVQPLNLVILVLVAGLCFLAWGRRGWGTRLLTIGAWALVVFSVAPLGQALILPLENRFARSASLPETVTGVIVLGGAALGDITTARGTIALADAAERLTALVALATRYPDARLVFSGGTGALMRREVPEAHIVADFVVSQGVAPGRLMLEAQSRNTWENARLTHAMIEPKPDETWLIVTSAFHMPRAVGIFRRIGWQVMPVPVDYRTVGTVELARFKPLEELVLLDVALKEWCGLLAYRVIGRTSALFPGPA